MMPLLLVGSLVIGIWLVHQTHQTYDAIQTCRYREYRKLSRRAEWLAMGYRFLGVASGLTLPGGVAVMTVIFAYALYRRFK